MTSHPVCKILRELRQLPRSEGLITRRDERHKEWPRSVKSFFRHTANVGNLLIVEPVFCSATRRS